MKMILVSILTFFFLGCNETEEVRENDYKVEIKNLGIKQLNCDQVLHRFSALPGSDNVAVVRYEKIDRTRREVMHTVYDQVFYNPTGEIDCYLAMIPQYKWRLTDNNKFTKNPFLKQWSIQNGELTTSLPFAAVTSSVRGNDSYTIHFTTNQYWTSENPKGEKDITLKFSLEILSLDQAMEHYKALEGFDTSSEWAYTYFPTTK